MASGGAAVLTIAIPTKVRGRYDLAQQSYYSGAAARRRDPMLVGELVPNPYPSPSPSPNPNPNPNQVEELVRAPRGMAAAPDFKFFVFGGHVAAIWYVQGRHTREECSAWCVVRGNKCPTILVIPSMYHATLHPTDHAILYCALTILAARYQVRRRVDAAARRPRLRVRGGSLLPAQGLSAAVLPQAELQDHTAA